MVIIMNKVILVSFLISLTGCSATPDEDMGALSQAFGASSCGTAAADQTFTGHISPAHTSPSTYSTCFRGYVVDVNNLELAYTGLGGGGGWDAHIAASWAGAVPTTQASCESAWGAAIFYKKVGSSWVAQTGQLEAFGIWHPAGVFVAWCETPALSTLGEFTLSAGDSYRVAATMRTSYGGATLRAVEIETVKKLILH
jgi:hypothetical protein